jgi:hypothetical protein
MLAAICAVRISAAGLLSASAVITEGAASDKARLESSGGRDRRRASPRRGCGRSPPEDWRFGARGGGIQGGPVANPVAGGVCRTKISPCHACSERIASFEKIGAGGSGVVYRAERADGHFEKQVAVKLLRAGAITATALKRFLNERQIPGCGG